MTYITGKMFGVNPRQVLGPGAGSKCRLEEWDQDLLREEMIADAEKRHLMPTRKDRCPPTQPKERKKRQIMEGTVAAAARDFLKQHGRPAPVSTIAEGIGKSIKITSETICKWRDREFEVVGKTASSGPAKQFIWGLIE